MEHKVPEITLEAATVEVADKRTMRWTRRAPNPVMQMSIRMQADVYDRFRAHCVMRHRTNGEMLEVMMAALEELDKNSQVT